MTDYDPNRIFVPRRKSMQDTMTVEQARSAREDRAAAVRTAVDVLPAESDVEDVLVVADWVLTGEGTLAQRLAADTASRYAGARRSPQLGGGAEKMAQDLYGLVQCARRVVQKAVAAGAVPLADLAELRRTLADLTEAHSVPDAVGEAQRPDPAP